MQQSLECSNGTVSAIKLNFDRDDVADLRVVLGARRRPPELSSA